MKVKEVLEFVSREIGVPANEFPDGGYWGSPETKVKGILVTWMMTADALRSAVRRGCNVVVCHEGFLFAEGVPGAMYRWWEPADEKQRELDDHPNRVRRRIIEENNLTVLAIHYGLDRLCLYDDFMRHLGITKVASGEGYDRIWELPKPQKASALARDVAKKMKMKSVRLVGDANKIIKKVGNLWGGVALGINRYWMRKQIEGGADGLICGEIDEIQMRFGLEYDTAMIETSHGLSENIGLRNFTGMLKKEFPRVKIHFYEVKLPYKEIKV